MLIVTELLLLKFLHLLGFVYWLGGDLGTFFASRFVVRSDLGVEARAIALKIMLGCDQGPKTCMPLMFPLGLQLSQSMGLTALPPWVLALVWVLAVVWSINVQFLYFSDNVSLKQRIAQFDFALRLLVIGLIVVYAVSGLFYPEWIRGEWLATKMLIFAALVACGLFIRVRLKPFVVAFTEMMASGPTPEVNQQMQASLSRVRPFVYVIWLGLFANAALGLHLI